MPALPKSTSYLRLLCLLLVAGAAVFAVFAVWLLARGGTAAGLAALGVGAAMAAAAWGLLLGRRWGVVIFGLLAMLGSINHLVNAVARYPAEAMQQPGMVAGAVVSILFAILVPAALLYLTLLLWRSSR